MLGVADSSTPKFRHFLVGNAEGQRAVSDRRDAAAASD
jgi:hypothetical protein